MRKKRISMDKIREIIRLHEELDLGVRKIADALSISKTAVSDYISGFKACSISYGDTDKLTDTQLYELLCGRKKKSKRYRSLEKNFCHFAKELKRRGVTLKLLWEGYIENNPGGYSYAQTAWHYRVWRQASRVTMHMEHKAGDKTFVDFTGEKFNIVDPKTGEVWQAEIFTSILGASQLAYVEATKSQRKEDWIRANENAFLKFGGVTAAIMPDQLRSAVTKSCKYEPDINPEYEDFARHYGTVIFPARQGKPRDKSLVEGLVKIAYQRILAPLRDETFFSLSDLNEKIFCLTDKHNRTPMQKLKVSRYELFLETEKDKLMPLPDKRYEFKNFAFPTVGVNYHIYLSEDGHYYSVPYRTSGKKVKVIYSSTAVEIYCDNRRIASHVRNRTRGEYTTEKDHMPSTHRYYAEWNPARITSWAAKVGPNVKKLTSNVLGAKKYPEQAYRTCIGIIGLARKYGNKRVDRACSRALSFKLYRYRAVKNILDKGLDKVEEEKVYEQKLPLHQNIRGAQYYKLT